jgi:hypothetical protein
MFFFFKSAGESLAVAANVTQLPTFVFYTTQLSENNELQTIEIVVGTNVEVLNTNFAKGVQIAHAFLAQRASLAQQQQQAKPVTSSQGLPSSQAIQQQSAPQGQGGPVGPGGDASIKRELLEIRTALIAGLQRLEQLYRAL